jgi:DeoR/GlpR family transcriptional regulator of sugar metabolism
MIGELSRFPNVKLCVVGGEYYSNMFFLGGSLMERVLETIAADIVFLGADAIDSSGHCLTLDQDTARTAQMMLRRGRRKILLADDTKVNASAQVVYASLRDFDLWITTRGLPRQQLKQFRKYTSVREV